MNSSLCYRRYVRVEDSRTEDRHFFDRLLLGFQTTVSFFIKRTQWNSQRVVPLRFVSMKSSIRSAYGCTRPQHQPSLVVQRDSLMKLMHNTRFAPELCAFSIYFFQARDLGSALSMIERFDRHHRLRCQTNRLRATGKCQSALARCDFRHSSMNEPGRLRLATRWTQHHSQRWA